MILGNALLNRKILMVMIAVVAAFSPMLNAGFVNYDDPDHIINNVYVQEPSLDHLLSVFQGDACILYVPVTTCSYYLDMFFGGTPAGFHLINIVFHLFNCLLLWKLLRNLKVSESIRFLLLVFFALDPVVTESVCWATERKDVLYTFFLLASAIFFLKEQERGTLKCYYASLFLFILSCLSKPMAVSFPFIAA
ncbi:MAG: transrane and repeat-containing protein, partial [Bacteroidetes bacterium]|nr:transrane and repeat-containing protein [Bacteroidota bacterium]